MSGFGQNLDSDEIAFDGSASGSTAKNVQAATDALFDGKSGLSLKSDTISSGTQTIPAGKQLHIAGRYSILGTATLVLRGRLVIR